MGANQHGIPMGWAGSRSQGMAAVPAVPAVPRAADICSRFQFGCSRFSSKGSTAVFCSNLHAIEADEQKPGIFSA